MHIDKEYYISHIDNKNAALKMRRILDKIEITLNQHYQQETDFLNPYELSLAEAIINQFHGLRYIIKGAYPQAERCIIVIAPEYFNDSQLMEAIDTLKISGGNQELTHKDYLGAILSLGIVREKIGDILVHKEYAYVIVKKESSSFIQYNLEKVKNLNVNINQIIDTDIELPIVKYKDLFKSLSSLRIDLFVAEILNISRKESQAAIKSGEVNINWEPINKASREVNLGDVISIRGFGRAIFNDYMGTSRKGKQRCMIRILL